MQNRDQFDGVLDGALKRYGDVEPRAGLESRVLARLAAQPQRTGYRMRWPLIWASVAAVLVFGFGLWFAVPRREKPPVTIAREVSRPITNETPHKPELTHNSQRLIETRRKLGQNIRHGTHGPRMHQFPSPRPASREELMLVEYVQRYPKEALLISQEQNEFEEQVKQDEQQINGASSSPTER